MPNRKLDLVKELRQLLPEAQQESVAEAMVTWWVNIRSSGGMRLTARGYEVMHQVLALESWRVDLPQRGSHALLDRKILLELDRKLEWPYYIDIRKRSSEVAHSQPAPGQLVLFGSREAMMAVLYGDLKKWLDSLD